ncbi:MAG: hypothetical protein AAFU85_03055 [Planctomycetota bacterium]
MEAFHAGIHRHPELIVELPNETANAVLAFLLGLACEAQHFANIDYGRRAILSIPRNWMLTRIHDVAQRELNLSDPWECRRLLELYSQLDGTLLHSFARTCSQSTNAEIIEAGSDFLSADEYR